MTPAAFRKLALELPETEERAHMAHPDFRVANKIFATLGYPDSAWAMVKLPLEQQHNSARRSGFDSAAPPSFTFSLQATNCKTVTHNLDWYERRGMRGGNAGAHFCRRMGCCLVSDVCCLGRDYDPIHQWAIRRGR